MKKPKLYQIRVGCDIVQISRFQKILARTPTVAERIFLPSERKNKSIEKLAGIFAAKEAVIKALGLKAGNWQKMEIKKAKSDRPQIKFLKSQKNLANYDLSISHDGDYAFAMVIFVIR